MTLDGFCDHTAGIADAELHQHYTELLRNAGAILYGRITYQMMENHWPTIVNKPTGDKGMDDFAIAMQHVPKIVFSRTLKDVGWENARLAKRDLQEEVSALRQSDGKDVFVGSPSLIAALTALGLFDEYQLCVHPVIAGKGLPLFKNISERIVLQYLRSKNLSASGATILYYQPITK